MRGQKYCLSKYIRHITLLFVLNKKNNKRERENKTFIREHTVPVLLSVGCTGTQCNQEKHSGMKFGVPSLAPKSSVMIQDASAALQ